MKTLASLLLLCLVVFSCKDTSFDPYVYPSRLVVKNQDCIQLWEYLNIEPTSDFDSRIWDFVVFAWFNNDSVPPRNIISSPPRNLGVGTRIAVHRRELNSVDYLHFQLWARTSKGAAKDSSQVYSFKKTGDSACMKWVEVK